MTYRYKIIDASAGTGKTFSLRKNILLKLLSNDNFTFKQILALTFTNKASNEMKQAILFDLFQISNNPQESDVLVEIEKEKKITNVKSKAQKILKRILNNFSFFQISTLDKFNHRLIRCFSTELGLSNDFELIVDGDEYTDLLIFEFLDNINDNEHLLKLITDYSINKVLDEKSWDIDYEMRVLIQLIFDETNYFNFLKLSEETNLNFPQIKKNLLEIIKNQQESIQENAKEYFSLIEEKQEYVFVYLTNFMTSILDNKIQNLKTDSISTRILNNEIFKKTYKHPEKDSITNKIVEITERIIQSVQSYSFYNNILKNLDLNELATEIIKFSNSFQIESNILFISDFNKKINKEILKQDTPYIYEKLSVRFKDYFIDEFQDTSKLQWQNLIPLSSHSMTNQEHGEDFGSLFLVGDPKQSIYRWRGASPEIFNSLKQKSPFFIKPDLAEKTENFRSGKNIVEFNNKFFKFISNKINIASVDESFKNLDQVSNKDIEGQTTITFIDKDNDIDESTQNLVLSMVLDKIAQGFSLKDIAIICRTNKQCNKISSYLVKKNIKIKSDEISSFTECNEIEVLVHFLRLKIDNNNKESQREILKLIAFKQNLTDKYSFINSNLERDMAYLFNEILQLDLVKFLSLDNYESVVYLTQNLKLFDEHLLYVQFLLDEIIGFDITKSYNKENFCDYWAKKKDKMKATFINDIDAVDVLTIHKAKGMEYECVILPYFDFPLKSSNFKVWIDSGLPKTSTKLFVDFNNSLKNFNSETKLIYEDKNDEMVLDSLNLMYVALSRAIYQNHVICTMLKSENLSSANGLCDLFCKEKKFDKFDVESDYQYVWGKSQKKNKNENTSSELIQSLGKRDVYDSQITTRALNQSKKSTHFGNIFHEIISKIENQNQIEVVINNFFNRGLISEEDRNKIERMIKSVFNNKKLKQFFETKENSYNEREIYLLKGEVIKPDRIIFHSKNNVSILDYKTGKPKISDVNQIKLYISKLEQNAYNVNQALLVYLDEKLSVLDVVNVEPS